MATHGIAIMSVREGLEFDTELESDTAALNHTVISLIEQFGEALALSFLSFCLNIQEKWPRLLEKVSSLGTASSLFAKSRS